MHKTYLLIFSLAISLLTPIAQAKQLNVTFAIPVVITAEDESFYWRSYLEVIQHAALQLNINLTVVYSPGYNRFDYLRQIKTICQQETKPDYLLYP